MIAKSDVQALLKHFLAAIVYRTQKALRGAPDSFAEFRAGSNVRTPHELLWYMTGLIGYARTLFLGGVWQPEKSPSFSQEIRRFNNLREDLGRLLDEEEFQRDKISPEQLLQGPLADAMTHVGQLAILRRLATSLSPPHPIQAGGLTCLLLPQAKACHPIGDSI